MSMPKIWVAVLACLAGLMNAPGARAQWAVVDVQAIGQLVQQVQILNQALNTARSQLLQAQQQFQSLTGTRGMQNLLAGTVRNYMPVNQSEFTAALQGASTYPGLAGAVQAAAQANAVLDDGQLAALPPDAQQQLREARAAVALLQGMAGTALSNASSRFASIQQLIDAIPTATDPKAILDLQARIQAEQGMLQNEQSKLQTLYQAAQAQQWAELQRGQERVVAGHGDFTSRFEPAP